MPEETKPIVPPTEPSTAMNMVEKAEAVAKAMKEQTDRYEGLVQRNEEASAMIRLSGGTNAGQTQKQETEDEKKKAGAKEFFKGTEIAKSIEKYG